MDAAQARKAAPEGPDLFSKHRFFHPILELMPFGKHAPAHLLEVERLVSVSLNEQVPASERKEAALTLSSKVTRSSRNIPDAPGLVAEVLTWLATELKLPTMFEQAALAHLRLEGVSVEFQRFATGGRIPRLVHADGQRHGDTTVSAGHDAVSLWEESVEITTAASAADLDTLPYDELCAAIRVLQHLIVHLDLGSQAVRRSPSFFEEVGASLWSSVSSRMIPPPGEQEDFRCSYGEVARQTLWHRIRGAAMPSEAKNSDEPEECGVQVTVNVPKGHHIIISGPIPAAATPEDNEMIARYAALQSPVPIAALPSLDECDALTSRLQAEFPWADEAIREITSDLRARRLFGCIELGMPPTLLVGQPGCGKSRLARRLAEELHAPFLPLSLAGSNDSMSLLGTSRGWATGQPSPLISFLLAHKKASALVLLDEVDKVGSASLRSVPPTVALLALLEPENSSRWHDSFLQTNCDLSKLLYCGTANRLDALSKPLLSRFRLVPIGQPGPEHFHAIAASAARDLAREWGLPNETLAEIVAEARPLGVCNAREVRSATRHFLIGWADQNLRRRSRH